MPLSSESRFGVRALTEAVRRTSTTSSLNTTASNSSSTTAISAAAAPASKRAKPFCCPCRRACTWSSSPRPI
nr:MAG TPA: conotoxin [Caudoviricetes sp.]